MMEKCFRYYKWLDYRFFQLDNSVTRHQEDTGIGLKKLVELHHGTINFMRNKITMYSTIKWNLYGY